MRIGILTSVELRHRHFVRRVSDRFEVSAVVYEQTGYTPARTDGFDLTADERTIIAQHYAERTRQEAIFFGTPSAAENRRSDIAVRSVDRAGLNTPATVEFLRAAGVDTVLVYGTDLIRPPLIEAFTGRMVNLHLGLSPYYRGTATNFYPLLNDEPEYVGATIHLIDAGIDSGAILTHARPDIVAVDRPHTIGCKAIEAGIDALLRVLPEWSAGQRAPVPQWHVPNAHLYLRKHFHPRQVVDLHQKIEAGLIEAYVARAQRVAPRVRLVS